MHYLPEPQEAEFPAELSYFSPAAKPSKYIGLKGFWLDASSFCPLKRTYKILYLCDGQLVEFFMRITQAGLLEIFKTSVYTVKGTKILSDEGIKSISSNPETFSGWSMKIFCSFAGLAV